MVLISFSVFGSIKMGASNRPLDFKFELQRWRDADSTTVASGESVEHAERRRLVQFARTQPPVAIRRLFDHDEGAGIRKG
jgi:hypothetical protein